MDILPRTIRDAITITCGMFIPYLWVDALCIVQDDDISKAWEINRMQDIYSSSTMTIVTSGATSASQGFLAPPEEVDDDSVLLPVRLDSERFGTMRLTGSNYKFWYYERSEPISTRGWTAQEQLLAQRKLVFTQYNHTMIWSCPHSPMLRAFGGSMHLPHPPGHLINEEEKYLRETRDPIALSPNPSGLSDGVVTDKDRALGQWLRLVMANSMRSVTFQADKLDALAGIAARWYAPLLGPGYSACMWEYGLLRQLMWRTSDTTVVGRIQARM
jgi:hypothetical protein